MSVARRSLAISVALLALFQMPHVAADPHTKAPPASPNRATVCALTVGAPTVASTFRVVSGRLSRGPKGFVLLDDDCPGRSLLLQESTPGILGETCSASAPKQGLRCLLDSATQPVFGTVSGMFQWKPGGTPTLVAWDLNDVSLGAPNNRVWTPPSSDK